MHVRKNHEYMLAHVDTLKHDTLVDHRSMLVHDSMAHFTPLRHKMY